MSIFKIEKTSSCQFFPGKYRFLSLTWILSKKNVEFCQTNQQNRYNLDKPMSQTRKEITPLFLIREKYSIDICTIAFIFDAKNATRSRFPRCPAEKRNCGVARGTFTTTGSFALDKNYRRKRTRSFSVL